MYFAKDLVELKGNVCLRNYKKTYIVVSEQ